MAISDYITTRGGWETTAMPIPSPLDFARVRGQKIANDQQALEYQERLKDIDNIAIERDIKRQSLEFQQRKQQEMLQDQYAQGQLQNQTAIDEELFTDLDAIKTEDDYNRVWDKYNELTSGKLPPEFVTGKGERVPYAQAKKGIAGFKSRVKNNVTHQRALDLAELRAYWQAQNSAQFTQSPDTTRQYIGARKRVENWLDETGFDLGNINKGDSNASWLVNVLSTVPNAVARMQSNRAGQGVNEESVRQEILNTAQDYISNNPGWLKGIFTNADFDKEGFLKAVDRKLGLSGGTMQEFINTPEVKASISGPAAIVYKSADEVKQAFSKGTLTKEEATKILQDKFGYE